MIAKEIVISYWIILNCVAELKQIVISYWIILNCIAELCSATLGVIGTVDSRSSKTDFSSLKFGSTSTLVGNECDKAIKINFEVIQ